jgi:hypothetical protein
VDRVPGTRVTAGATIDRVGRVVAPAAGSRDDVMPDSGTAVALLPTHLAPHRQRLIGPGAGSALPLQRRPFHRVTFRVLCSTRIRTDDTYRASRPAAFTTFSSRRAASFCDHAANGAIRVPCLTGPPRATCLRPTRRRGSPAR